MYEISESNISEEEEESTTIFCIAGITVDLISQIKKDL